MTVSLYSTAVHEAAHAVVAVRTARGKSHGLAKNGVVTIDRHDEYLGSVQSKHSGSGKHRHERDIMVSLAGGIAHCRVEPASLGALAGHLSSDIEHIIFRLGKFHPSFPFVDAGYELFSQRNPLYRRKNKEDEWKAAKAKLFIDKVTLAVATLCTVGDDVKAAQNIAATPQGPISVISEPWFHTLGRLTNRTVALLDKHWREVHALANRLLEDGTMQGPEAEDFILKVA